MPFVNVDQPIFSNDEPDFLRTKRKASFDSFVVACKNGQEISEEKFSEIWNMRWNNFAAGVLDESIVFIDILAADRPGYTVDLQFAFDNWLHHQKS